MRAGLPGKRTSTLTAVNYCTVESTVEIVDRTPPVINPKARYCNRDFRLPHLHIRRLRYGGRGPHRNIAMTFGMEN